MDSEDNLQDLVRCVSCDTPNPILHCDICHTPLCKSCVREHLLDESKEHKVVSFKDRGHNPNIPNNYVTFTAKDATIQFAWNVSPQVNTLDTNKLAFQIN